MSLRVEPSKELAVPGWLLPALVASSALCVGVLLFILPPTRADISTSLLPALNAGLNSAATVCLLVGYWLVRRGAFEAHRRTMLFALGLSGLFLVSYLVHHAQAGSVPYAGPPSLRGLYLAILLPHIVLAAAVLPLAMLTVFRGLKDQRVRHRRIARITLPLWLYVSVSGVVVYLMVYRLG